MPVCRYPIVGEADRTVSPSSSSTSRSTPCVLGCCGPMLTVIVSLRSSGIVLRLPYHGVPGEADRLTEVTAPIFILPCAPLMVRVLRGVVFSWSCPHHPLLISRQPIPFHVRPELLLGYRQRFAGARRHVYLHGIVLPER